MGVLIDQPCADDDSASAVIGSYYWIHSCSDTCLNDVADCSSVAEIGDFCTIFDVICMKVLSTIVGTEGEFSSSTKNDFFFEFRKNHKISVYSS